MRNSGGSVEEKNIQTVFTVFTTSIFVNQSTVREQKISIRIIIFLIKSVIDNDHCDMMDQTNLNKYIVNTTVRVSPPDISSLEIAGSVKNVP